MILEVQVEGQEEVVVCMVDHFMSKLKFLTMLSFNAFIRFS